MPNYLSLFLDFEIIILCEEKCMLHMFLWNKVYFIQNAHTFFIIIFFIKQSKSYN